MLGAVAISERSISDQGVILPASESLNFQFDVTKNAVITANGAADITAISTKASIGVGVLVGLMQASANFAQTLSPLRFAAGVSGVVCSATQTSAGTFIGSAISEQAYKFIQDSIGQFMAGGTSEQSFNFTKDTSAIALFSPPLDLNFSFTEENIASKVVTSSLELQNELEFVQTGGILIYRSTVNVDALVIQTTNGALLWERVDADTPSESWIKVSHSGGTWTEIDASATIEQWTKTVV